MRIAVLISSFLITLIIISSCDNSPTGPEEPPPGRRDYVWEVDTLAIPFMSFNRIWGSSPQNVWIVGPGGGLDKTIFQYDGNGWETDGISRPISPACIWGFSDNEVWMGGLNGKIWHYDGSSWIEDTMFVRPKEKDIGFQEIWGDSPNNLFAAGYSGYEDLETRVAVLAHYDGNSWELIEFDSLKNYNFLRIRRNTERSNKYYIQAIKDQRFTGDLFSLFEYKGGDNIKLIYEGPVGNNTSAFIQEIDNEMFFVIGKTINKYINNEFKTIIQIPFPNFGNQIFGKNKNDIFLRMTDGISHYNGNNIQYIYNFEGRISITDAVLFENEVFFLAFDLTNGNDLIYRGKLN